MSNGAAGNTIDKSTTLETASVEKLLIIKGYGNYY